MFRLQTIFVRGRRALRQWRPSAAGRNAGLTPAVLERLRQRVAQSERQHSGEIRICVERALPWADAWATPAGEPAWRALLRERALGWFGRLRVWDTEHNNGVLIYLLLSERTIEIVADRGLNTVVAAAQWAELTQGLSQHLASGQAETGLLEAVDAVSAWLHAHFPLAQGASNPNELPDEVVMR